jgi:hypothetical protein
VERAESGIKNTAIERAQPITDQAFNTRIGLPA